LIRLSRQSPVPPFANLEPFARSLGVLLDQRDEHVSVTRLRLAPAAEHLAAQLLPCTSAELFDGLRARRGELETGFRALLLGSLLASVMAVGAVACLCLFEGRVAG
jgi:hypothetical protein